MAHRILDHHRGLLNTMTGRKADEDAASQVEAQYWRVKTLADKIKAPLTEMDLVWIVLDSGAPIPGARERHFLDEVNDGGVHWDHQVEAKWRFGHWYPGLYKGYRPDGKIIVAMENDNGEERAFAPECVRNRDVEVIDT